MTEMTYTEKLVVVHCWCGIALAIPSNLNRVMHDEGHSAYCPLGHKFLYGDSYKEKLAAKERELEAERKRVKATRDLLHAEERSHSATKGQLTKVKKRVQAGVCPHCNRTFQNLARHMCTKHPEEDAG